MTSLVSRWSSEPFKAAITRWVDQQLHVRDQRRSGPVEELKVRFWSAVFKVPLGAGWAYFKVSNPGQAFEGEALRVLSRVAPGKVIEPWAVDVQEGWTLLPDGGSTLDWASEPDWLALISDVAQLQRVCAGHAGELGLVPKAPVETVEDSVERMVHELASRPVSDRHHLDGDLAARCLERVPYLRNRMEVLLQAGLPSTLQPNDIHPGNAVRPLTAGLPSRLFDLGDAVWSHPWAVLHVAGRGIGGVGLNDPWPDNAATRRLVDAYAEHWPEIRGPGRSEVLEAADLLGALHRFITWERMIAAVSRDEQQDQSLPELGLWLAEVMGRIR